MNKISRIVVLGAGSAGFLSAVTLKRLLPEMQVAVVFSSRIPVIGVGESTNASFPTFLHRTLQLDPNRFYKEVRPSWKLGVRFDWGDPHGPHFNYTFDGIFNVRPDPLKKRTSYYCLDDPRDFSHFSALMERAIAPVYRGQGGQIQMQKGFGYHLNNKLFLRYLKTIATQLGIELIEGDVVKVEQDQSGDVSALVLEQGPTIVGDLFVDCSGFRSLLLTETMNEKQVSYADSLFCDRAIVGSWENKTDTVLPYTMSETMDHGWCWRIDFEDRVTRGYVHCSQFCDEEQAMREMREKNPKLGDDLRTIKFRSGRSENFWSGNVVAIGNACGFVEPLEATALHLIAQQLMSVCGVLVDGDGIVWPEVIAEENRQYRRAWDEVRDFLALHYKFNYRKQTPFWQHCQNETNLGTVQQLVDMYKVAGPHRSCEGLIPLESTFGFDGYVTMLVGLRVPTDYRNNFTPADYAEYNGYRDRIRSDIARAMPVRDAHQAAAAGSVQWPS